MVAVAEWEMRWWVGGLVGWWTWGRVEELGDSSPELV